MARSILPHENNPALREISREIPLAEITSPKAQSLIREMQELLSKEAFGVALAACQVGEPVRLFIVSGKALAERAADSEDGAKRQEGVPPLPDQIYINPVLTKMSRGRKDKHEGCLSIRGKWGMVPRAEKATITAYDESGKKFTRGASGFLAHIYQHEMDHLNAILYTDKATEVFADESDTRKIRE